MRRLVIVIAAAALAVGALALPAVGASNTETIDLVGQGPAGPQAGTAELTRSPSGLRIKVTMPTPAPGSYTYPSGATNDGGPEAFSLWAFVFANPGACSDGSCSGLGDVAASGGGVFNVAGHISANGTLVLAGHISKNSNPFALNQLTNIDTAEVHVAVAPHGKLDPSQMPAQVTTPIGGPADWWIALFK